MEPREPMDPESRFWITIWSIVAVAVIVLICGITYSEVNKVNKAFEHGYEQQAVPGLSGVYWVKKTPAGVETLK